MVLLTRNLRLAAVVALAWPGAPFCPAEPALTGSPVVTTQAVYAAFIVNLTRFITWPANSFPAPGAPLVVGTFARDPINEDLDEAVKGEVVDGHPLQTIRIHSLDDLPRCHVVFLSRSNTRHASVLARCANKPVLLIGDTDGFLQLGGHVRFVSQPPHTRLRISLENLKASGLQCRAQLLQLASTP